MSNRYVGRWAFSASVLLGIIAVIVSLIGLFTNYPYALETENWQLQAQGQDIGNLLGVSVLWWSAWLAKKGSVKAYLVWLGTLFYFLYAYIIYAVAVHFNSLFLLYVTAIGLSLYTIIFSLARGTLPVEPRTGKKLAGYTLIGMGLLFGLMWLGETIPASIKDEVPKSLQNAGLWVNPIHVIDLSAVLPAFILTGYWTLKHKRAGLFFAAPWLTFSVLMGSSIVAAMTLMLVNDFENALPPMVMVSIVVLVSLIALVRFTKQFTPFK